MPQLELIPSSDLPYPDKHLALEDWRQNRDFQLLHTINPEPAFTDRQQVKRAARNGDTILIYWDWPSKRMPIKLEVKHNHHTRAKQ